ncbi:DUF3426 domain-containing protein [Luteimonas huabeiensis]|uniref:DUF3426 domain-containing protein n=1 Tax=Luteimonas huabeiensis TaxID=1244513 RepID=UPI0004652124|nr:DUF3426 domain-containing protein [Luteimonas huabeiensis]
MFVNCPGCSALVATDLVTDLPPERCPYCSHALRAAAPAAGSAPPARSPPETPAPAPPIASPGAPGPRFVPLRARPATAEAPAPQPTATPRPILAPAPAAKATDAQAPRPAPAPPAAGAHAAGNAATPPPPGPVPPPSPRPVAAPTPARSAPSFLRPRGGTAPAAPRERLAMAIAIPLLLLALGTQLLLADRARLAADPAWRPWVAAACTVARCTLPAWREPGAIALLQRDVRPHPDRPGQLRVAATLRNDAARAQAWPMLSLTLSDAEGRPLAARWFAPEEYRPAGAPDTLAPGQSARVGFDIVEPSPHAVAFNFDFG